MIYVCIKSSSSSCPWHHLPNQDKSLSLLCVHVKNIVHHDHLLMQLLALNEDTRRLLNKSVDIHLVLHPRHQVLLKIFVIKIFNISTSSTCSTTEDCVSGSECCVRGTRTSSA